MKTRHKLLCDLHFIHVSGRKLLRGKGARDHELIISFQNVDFVAIRARFSVKLRILSL